MLYFFHYLKLYQAFQAILIKFLLKNSTFLSFFIKKTSLPNQIKQIKLKNILVGKVNYINLMIKNEVSHK